MPEIATLSAIELLALYRTRELSPVEATEAVLRRIRTCNPLVNAFCLLDEESARADARASEDRWMKGKPAGLVDGVPATIKDVALAKDWPTRLGSRTVPVDKVWDEDAPVTARLRKHGAVLLGKTTTPEFGWKGVTDSPLTGITRNPWDTRMTPGGSSGGAAAAAALGMGALHIGSDGGGSIRIPAGFTGIFGLKPSYGRVPSYPASAYGTLSHLGPMTRTVADAALMLTVISRPDARDWMALPYDGQDYRDGLEDGVAGLRIAFSPDLGYAEVDGEVAAAVRAAAQVFADLGATVEETAPGFEDPAEIFRLHWYAGAALALGTLSAGQRKMMDPGLDEVAREGAGIGLLEYLEAVGQRAALGRHMCRFHETYDLLITPSLPIAAFAAGMESPDPSPSRWSTWTPFTFPFNLTQQPACSVPCGFTGAGLPVGLQIVGPMHGDGAVLRAARAYETAHPFVMPEAARAGAD